MTGPNNNLGELPEGLPVPEDDGAADHLEGTRLPPVGLRSTDGGLVDLSALPGRTVVYCYPMTGRPDRDLIAEDAACDALQTWSFGLEDVRLVHGRRPFLRAGSPR